MRKKTQSGPPTIGPPGVIKRASEHEYERVQEQADVHPADAGPFQAQQTEGLYGGVTAHSGITPPTSGPDLAAIRDRILELPFHARLALLNSLAPTILENLSPNDREAFFISLSEELERRVGGQGSLPYH